MKKISFFTLLFLLAGFSLRASHNVAGQITLRCLQGNLYEATVTVYIDTTTHIDRCSLDIDWGDGSPLTSLPRVDGPYDSDCGGPGWNPLPPYPYMAVSYYRGNHQYPPSGTFHVKMIDPNRVAFIQNLVNSDNIPFVLETTFTIDPIIGCNSTPYLTTIPLDNACMGHCWYHNPGAVDPDGDSLSYALGPCLDTLGNPFPVPEYQMPDVIGGGNLTINPITGDIAWCSPQQNPGRYNFEIYIYEWRKLPSGIYYNIGVVHRDMDIVVNGNCSNDNPAITALNDTCVDAGTSFSGSFLVTDPNSNNVMVQGFGAPFHTTPPATLVPDSVMTPVSYTATFSWQTSCDEVRLQPWYVTFLATDDAQQYPLSDLKSFGITVVSPGPAALTATPQGATMHLSWSPAPCTPVNNFLTAYRVYRKQGCNTWTPSHCETGVPSYTGYVLIGTTNASTTVFTDDNGGNGLSSGVDYSYRVCAVFHDAAQSYASPEACAELLRDVPVIDSVDVQSTGLNDTINVRWVNALANGIDFDTSAHPGNYILKIERSPGFTMSAPVTIATFNTAFFGQLPVKYTDTGLQTASTAYCYRILFYAGNGNDYIGSSASASSVFVSAAPSDNAVTLTWRDSVPWTNDTTIIYRHNSTTNSWDSIGYSRSRTYTDGGRENGVQYCYFVKTKGSYFNPALPAPLFNRSQQLCAVPEDLTPPCAPNLIVNSDCYIGQNQLTWTNPINMNCGTDDVVSYNIWYAPTEDTAMTVIATVSLPSDTTLVFGNLFSVAGCYAVTALDTFGNQSALSNIVCQDNCPDYSLPNVFTPNADGTNDFLIPFPYRQIKDIDLKIYDRWGVVVFSTHDPAINWNGHDERTGKLCTDGVYYYVCVVDEIHLDGIHQRVLKGFVHLFGKNAQQAR